MAKRGFRGAKRWDSWFQSFADGWPLDKFRLQLKDEFEYWRANSIYQRHHDRPDLLRWDTWADHADHAYKILTGQAPFTYLAQQGSHLVGHGGPVKIGEASDPKRRLSSLSSGFPFDLEIVHITYVPESELHSMFSENRISQRGEWFSPCIKMLDLPPIATPSLDFLDYNWDEDDEDSVDYERPYYNGIDLNGHWAKVGVRPCECQECQDDQARRRKLEAEYRKKDGTRLCECGLSTVRA